MKNIIRIIIFLILLIFFTGCTAIPTDMPEAEDENFDSKNIVFKLAIISDTHINMAVGITSRKFEKTLKYLKEVAGEDLKVLMHAGDITDGGKKEEAEEFKRILDANLPQDVSFFYAVGNHDDGYIPKKFRETFGEEYFSYDVDPDQINKGNRHAVVGGYHFITVKPAQYWNGNKGTTFLKTTLTWLTETLDSVVAEDPDKPIFVVSHSPVAEMGIGSYLPQLSTFDLKEVLINYPQVVYTNGHLHNPIQNETAIMQDKFTTVDGGVIYYAGKDEAIEKDVFPYVVQDNLKDYNRQDHAFGTVLEIDKNNAVRITRVDYHNEAIYPVKWVIPPVKADGSHLSAYRDQERYDADIPPYFESGASVVCMRSSSSMAHVKFSAAKDENFVHHYKVDVYDVEADKVVYTANLESGFFRFSDMSSIQDEYVCSVKNVEDDRDYELRIRAFDSWYKEGEPLVYKFKFE